MKPKVKYAVIILLSCALLTCFGGEIVYQSESDLVWPYKVNEKKDGAIMVYEYAQKNVDYQYQGSSVQPEFYTLSEIKEKWGYPSGTIKTADSKIYVFETGNSRWSGFRLYFIVPIPVMFPTDDERYLVTTKQDRVAGIRFLTSGYTGFQCGFLSAPINWSNGTSGGYCRLR